MANRVKLNIRNFDDIYKQEDGESKLVTSHKPVVKHTFNDKGIFSRLIFGNMTTEAYSCKCGHYNKYYFKGTICPECKTVVKENDLNVKRSGWIDLQVDCFISPLMYNFISQIVPLDKVIKYQLKIDENGYEVVENDVKYSGIGLLEFKNKFKEILDYFYTLKPDKKEIYEFILENERNIWISKYPIYNSILRPAQLIGDKFVYDDVNKFFNFIIRNSNIIKKAIKIEGMTERLYSIMYDNQNYLMEIFDYIIDMLKGKEGIMRNELLGTRVNFSSRSVIIPWNIKDDFGMGDIGIPYKTGVEFFRYHLCNILSNIKGINYVKANKIVNNALIEFNEEIYILLNQIINNSEQYTLLNR